MTRLFCGTLVTLAVCCATTVYAQQRSPQQQNRVQQQRSRQSGPRSSENIPRQRQAQRSPVAPQKSAPGVRVGKRPSRTGPSPQIQAPQIPKGFPLNRDDQARVDDVLMFWEQNTTAIKTFQCDFTKWDYDGVFGVKRGGKPVAKSQSDGILKYSKPDKGLFQVKEVRDLIPPKAGEKLRYKKRAGSVAERWVCDGATVYEFDFEKKQLIETVLPPGMRGQAITSGPLPFMFGARAKEIKQRYWIRELTPPKEVTDQYWLEAYPKRREDAANFRRVVIFLDQKRFLPIAMRVYGRGKSYSAYAFKNRKTNDFMNSVQNVFKQYIPKKLPAGWQRIKRSYGDVVAKTGQRNSSATVGAKTSARTANRTPPRRQTQRK